MFFVSKFGSIATEYLIEIDEMVLSTYFIRINKIKNKI